MSEAADDAIKTDSDPGTPIARRTITAKWPDGRTREFVIEMEVPRPRPSPSTEWECRIRQSFIATNWVPVHGADAFGAILTAVSFLRQTLTKFQADGDVAFEWDGSPDLGFSIIQELSEAGYVPDPPQEDARRSFPAVLEREFTFIQDGEEKMILFRMGQPESREVDSITTWRCPFQLVGWGKGRVHYGHGMDALRAWHCAETIVAVWLKRAQDEMEIRWFGIANLDLTLPLPLGKNGWPASP